MLVFLGILFCNVSWADGVGLESLRMDVAGVEPGFEAGINEYYLVVEGDIESLEISAVPNNKNSVVEVRGNSDLKYGMNVVSVVVEDKSSGERNEYLIYVTKTDEPEFANARLENLAVRQGDLVPEFSASVTRYSMEVQNDVHRLDVLGIAEKMNAIVEVSGNDDLKIGDNLVEVKCVAEDGVTFRRYLVNVHRRSAEEEALYVEDRRVQTERLQSILNSGIADRGFVNFKTNGDINNVYIGIIVIFSGLIIGAGLYFIKRKIG